MTVRTETHALCGQLPFHSPKILSILDSAHIFRLALYYWIYDHRSQVKWCTWPVQEYILPFIDQP